MKTTTSTTSEELFRQAALEGSRLLSQPQRAVINGDDNDNILNGTNGDDQINGRGGNDQINGRGGNDWLNGGAGNDTYRFGAGFDQDQVEDPDGNDRIEFTAHRRDQISLSRAGEDLLLKAGNDQQVTVRFFFHDPKINHFFDGPKKLSSTDVTVLESQPIEVAGEPDSPIIQPISGWVDPWHRQGGDIYVPIDPISEWIDPRIESISFTDNTVLGFDDVLAALEAPARQNTTAQAAGGTLSGSRFNDVLNGHNGEDQLYGYRGNDQLYGRNGNDILYGDQGDDQLDGGIGNDYLNGGYGNDTYRFGTAFGQDEIYDYDGKDRIEFSHHKRSDVRFSSSLEDSQAHLLIDTADGNQITVRWQYDNDPDGIEAIQFADGSILQAADFLKPYLINGTANHDTLNGSFGRDIINGHSGHDKLYGGDGNDVLTGGWGDDHMWGDNGNDVLYGEHNNDRLFGGSGNDRLYGNSGNDLLGGGWGDDRLWGGDGNDTLYGEHNNDVLYGGAGKDILYGGAGKDTFVFDSALNSSNVDTVKDFSRGTDLLALGKAIFSGLGNSIEAAEFGLGSSATNSSQRILFNQADGKLYYDADGNGSAAAVHFATLQGSGLNQLDHTSFNLI